MKETGFVKPAKHVFRKVEYRIKWRRPRMRKKNVGGSCSAPTSKRPTIEIHPKLCGLNKLRVLVDESIHACFWDIDNESVAEASNSIAVFLWNCGARIIEESDYLPHDDKPGETIEST